MLGRLDSIREYLSRQTVIRVHFDSMPKGIGNQAATYNFMRRLRELGFNGKFECIYFNGANEHYPDEDPEHNRHDSMKKKLIKLFNLPNDFPDIYFDAENNCEFIEGSIYFENLRQKKVQHHQLSITSGEIQFCHDLVMTRANVSITQAELDSEMCKNQARTLEVDTYILVQPFSISANKTESNYVAIYHYNSVNLTYLHEGNDLFFNVPPAATFDQVYSLLKEENSFPNLKNQKPALLSLMQGIANKKFHTMPFYGWPIVMRYGVLKNSLAYYMHLMTHYLAGIKYAQLTNAPALQNKAFVLPVFYDYRHECNAITSFVNHDTNMQLPPVVARYFKTLNLRADIICVDISDKNFRYILNHLKPGQILIVSMGNKMPQNIFDAIYVYGATLPQVHEGENTRYLLMRATNKPFLRSETWIYSPDSHGPEKWYPSASLIKRYAAYHQMNSFYMETILEKSEWIMNFILDSLKPDSELSLYFNKLHEESNKPENDRVVLALNSVVNSISSAFSWCGGHVNSLLDRIEKSVMEYSQDLVKECPGYYNENHPSSQLFRSRDGFFYHDVNNTCARIKPAHTNMRYIGK